MDEVPPSVGWAEAVPESREWFRENLGNHVEGYHLLDKERAVGLVYYATSEKALLPYEVEPGVACVYCTELLPDYLHKGYGRMMLDYVKEDLKKRGFKGIMIPATDFKEFMHYELFQKQGFQIIEEHPPYKIMYFPLTKESISVKVFGLSYTPSRDKVEVTLFRHFFCPVGTYMYHLQKRVAESFGDEIRIVEMEATVETIRRIGTTGPLINGKEKLIGPASEEQVRKAIQEEIDRFHEG